MFGVNSINSTPGRNQFFMGKSLGSKNQYWLISRWVINDKSKITKVLSYQIGRVVWSNLKPINQPNA